MWHMSIRTRPLLSVLWLVSCAAAPAPQPPTNVCFERDIVYGKVGDVELKLNLARPKDATSALPCVVVIHGGGWAAGDRSVHDDLTWLFASRGYVSATVGYRFAPKYPFPAQVQDVKCAVRFLRANAAKYNIDPDHIGAVGFSAGAHLTMMLATMDKADGLDDSGGCDLPSSKVQAAVSYFGPTDLTATFPDTTRRILSDFICGSLQDKADAYRKASPITHVNPGDAPMLLFQGTKDPLVPHQQAIAMIETMTKANIPGRVELLAGAGHGWGGADLERTKAATFAFFDRYLQARKK
jgi:acetyl esterase/lipase